MVICNIAEPITLLLVLLGVVLTVFLGKETKKSFIVAIMLFLFLALLIFHGVQLGLANKTDADLVYSATYNMGLDFAFVFFLLLHIYGSITSMQKPIKRKALTTA